ncbi:hypothetical protein ACJIZ3_018209 [Penstemon smallii]|uniref:RanBP2-type domain-containing protein n=1 Tax=Penstemon smallii TaxID=265156 RepID=A0ABD3SXT3_9LAMI
MGGGGGGKEGDWECSSCRNRNYAFRSFCNRCKQPRLLVDTKTPADSKWLPRIGDWICTDRPDNTTLTLGEIRFFIRIKSSVIKELGISSVELFNVFCVCVFVLDGGLACVFFTCILYLAAFWVGCVCNGSIGCTNNNYASREKCKKCGQPKEVAAMPAVAVPGASVSTHPTYFSRAQGVEQMVNVRSLQQSLSLSSNYPLGGVDKYGSQPYGLHPTSSWHFRGNNVSGFPFGSQTNQLPPVSNGNEWRSGDWMCTCGFHNYSSRVQCKKCDAPAPIVTPSSLASTAVTALGTKRMASEEIHNWDNKRLNAGQAYGLQQSYPGYLNSLYPPVPNGSSGVARNLQVNLQMMHAPATPTVLGKGSNQLLYPTGQSNGVTGIGCAQIAIITTMHPGLNVIGESGPGPILMDP